MCKNYLKWKSCNVVIERENSYWVLLIGYFVVVFEGGNVIGKR